ATHQFAQRADVMALDLVRIPAASGPLVGERTESKNLITAIGCLPLIVVDDDANPIELAPTGKHRRFPQRALVALSVADRDVDSVVAAGNAPGKRHAQANRQAMTERAGRCLDTRRAMRAGMLRKPAAVAVELVEPGGRKKAAHRQRLIERR